MKKFLLTIGFYAFIYHAQDRLFAQQNHETFSATASTTVVQRPPRTATWVFIMAGQSNMAGRAAVEPQDTVTNPRILTINPKGEIILAREPLHFYEPAVAGLDCGLSFAKALLSNIPDSVSILLIPTAVGGSSIGQWLGDSLHRGVKLFSNWKEKVLLAQRLGTIKAILWHQGESDAKKSLAGAYQQSLPLLMKKFRAFIGDKRLPILTAPIGMFAKDTTWHAVVNKAIAVNAANDPYTFCISGDGFRHKGDNLHFDAASQRLMGERMAVLLLQNGKRKQ